MRTSFGIGSLVRATPPLYTTEHINKSDPRPAANYPFPAGPLLVHTRYIRTDIASQDRVVTAAHSDQFSRRHCAAAADQARSTHRCPVAGTRAFRRRIAAAGETQQDLGAC